MSSAIQNAPAARRPRRARRCGWCRQAGHDRRRCQAYQRHLRMSAAEDRRLDELRRLQAQLEEAKADHARLLAMRSDRDWETEDIS